MKMTELGKVIRKMRIDTDVSQKKMAFTIGVSSSYLSAVELGKREPSVFLIEKIERFFEGEGILVGSRIRHAAKKSRARITISLRDKTPEFVESLHKLLSEGGE